jgi:hypothetical protein
VSGIVNRFAFIHVVRPKDLNADKEFVDDFNKSLEEDKKR